MFEPNIFIIYFALKYTTKRKEVNYDLDSLQNLKQYIFMIEKDYGRNRHLSIIINSSFKIAA
jgi:hypothetical protein